jgi:hypothetical protein
MRQAPGVLTEMAGERAILLDADSKELITLNPVGSVIWGLLHSDRTLDELLALVAETFPDAALTDLAQDVPAFIEELDEAGLLTSDAAR